MNVYEIITQRFVEALGQGIVPWRRAWTTGGIWPTNWQSQKAYRGINVLLLAIAGFASPYWLTYRQATAMGGQVQKGAKGTQIIFWSKVSKRKEGDKDYFVLRYYTVFNAEQIDGIAFPVVEEPNQDSPLPASFEACKALSDGYRLGPKVRFKASSEPCYAPLTDIVEMPPVKSFASPEEFYSTLFHELVHSTGHHSRLDRQLLARDVDHRASYAKEELIAEIGAAFLCQRGGISPQTIDNSLAYVQGWASKLRSDPKLIVEAASAAMKAVAHIAPEAATEAVEVEEAA